MKEEYYLYTFESTHAAIKTDKLLKSAGSIVMPVPRFLSSSCGISVRIAPDKHEAAESIIKEKSGLKPFVDEHTEFDYRYWHINIDNEEHTLDFDELNI